MKEKTTMPVYISFRDTLEKIETVSEEAEILYVPYEHYDYALNAFSRDQREVDRILT